MSTVGQRERATQDRVVALFRDALDYDHLGNWQYREGNANVEAGLLTDWLRRRGISDRLITNALRELDQAAALGEGKSLYDANRAVYDLLRYGVKVKEGAGEHKETVWLVDWEHPEENDFAVAEEVAVAGAHGKRPDVVVYVNGIALGRPRTQALDGLRLRGDPPEPRQPEARVHPALLHDGPVRHGRERHGGPPLRRDRDAGEVLPRVARGGPPATAPATRLRRSTSRPPPATPP